MKQWAWYAPGPRGEKCHRCAKIMRSAGPGVRWVDDKLYHVDCLLTAQAEAYVPPIDVSLLGWLPP